MAVRTTARDAADQADAITKLQALLKPGDTVYVILKHVSRSGMVRTIDPLIVGKDGEIDSIAWLVGRALRERQDHDRGGIVCHGVGMDMGFNLVYCLSYALFPESFVCIGEHCPANDHSNGDRDYTPHQHSKGAGGYALRHRWL